MRTVKSSVEELKGFRTDTEKAISKLQSQIPRLNETILKKQITPTTPLTIDKSPRSEAKTEPALTGDSVNPDIVAKLQSDYAEMKKLFNQVEINLLQQIDFESNETKQELVLIHRELGLLKKENISD